MQVRGLDPALEEQRAELVESWYEDEQLFCLDVLHETFDKPFTPLHDEIFGAIKSDSNKKLILAPRGLGKTSICRSIVIHAILYRKKHFIVYISNTLTVADRKSTRLNSSH